MATSRELLRQSGERQRFLHRINRNKRGIVLDLTKPEGKELYFRLVRTADIIVDNLRLKPKPSSHQLRRKLQYNPKIICTRSAPSARMAPTADGRGSIPSPSTHRLMSVTGEETGNRSKLDRPIADATCANLVAFSAMVGLWTREQQDRSADRSVSDGRSHPCPAFTVGQFFLMNLCPAARGQRHAFYAPYGTFTCRDGQDIRRFLQ